MSLNKPSYNMLGQDLHDKIGDLSQTNYTDIASGLKDHTSKLASIANTQCIEIEMLRGSNPTLTDDDLVDLAISNAISNGIKKIKFASRTYVLNKSHTVQNTADNTKVKGITFVGDGYDTLIQTTIGVDGVFIFNIPSTIMMNGVSKMRFDSTTTNSNIIKFMAGGQYFIIDEVLFVNSSTLGTAIYVNDHNNINNVLINKCWINGFNIGISTQADFVNINQVTIRSCNTGITGIGNVVGATCNNITACEIAQCGNSIYFDSNSYRVTLNISFCRIESSNGYDIYIQGYDNGTSVSRGITLLGNYISNQNNTSLGVHFERTRGLYIANNTFRMFTNPPITALTTDEAWAIGNTLTESTSVAIFGSGASVFNKFQILNADAASVGSDTTSYFRIGSVVSLPSPSSTYRGRIIRVLGDGSTTADSMYICLQGSTGSYSWKPIATG